MAATKNHETLSLLERMLEVFFSIIGMLFVGGFFIAHQVLNTGFFTAEFGARKCWFGVLHQTLRKSGGFTR